MKNSNHQDKINIICSIRKIKEGQYIINDIVKVWNINIEESKSSDEENLQLNISCNIDFNDSDISEEQANNLASMFINDAMRAAIEKD